MAKPPTKKQLKAVHEGLNEALVLAVGLAVKVLKSPIESKEDQLDWAKFVTALQAEIRLSEDLQKRFDEILARGDGDEHQDETEPGQCDASA